MGYFKCEKFLGATLLGELTVPWVYIKKSGSNGKEPRKITSFIQCKEDTQSFGDIPYALSIINVYSLRGKKMESLISPEGQLHNAP